MRFRRTISLAAGSAWQQRRRAWPAALGIAAGVASMVGMTAAGQGAERVVLDRIRSMGADLVVVSAGQVKLVAGRPRQLGNVTTLLADDARAVSESCPSVLRAAPAQSRKLPAKWGNTSTTTTVLGTTPELLAIRDLAVASGRFFDDEEDRGALRVAVLGTTVVRNLFDGRSPLGETVRLNRVPFLVAGVLAPRGLDTGGNDQDDIILVPVRTALRRLFNVDYVDNLFVQIRPGTSDATMADVRALLRERHPAPSMRRVEAGSRSVIVRSSQSALGSRMSQPELAIFKYSHEDRADLGRTRVVWIRVTAALALVAAVLAFPFGLAVLIAPAIVYFSAPKRIHVGPRYLICGRRIVYYANVVRLSLDENAGQLRIESAGGAPLVLEREKFPTNARKRDKVARNKAEKFAKVKAKIVEKVRAAAPDADLKGIPR